MKKGARHCWVIYREKIFHTVLETCAFLKAILGSLAAFCRYLKGSKHRFRFSEEGHGKQFSALLVTLSGQRNALKTTSAHDHRSNFHRPLKSIHIGSHFSLPNTEHICMYIWNTPTSTRNTRQTGKIDLRCNRCM
jgi:hypothetical protein